MSEPTNTYSNPSGHFIDYVLQKGDKISIEDLSDPTVSKILFETYSTEFRDCINRIIKGEISDEHLSRSATSATHPLLKLCSQYGVDDPKAIDTKDKNKDKLREFQQINPSCVAELQNFQSDYTRLGSKIATVIAYARAVLTKETGFIVAKSKSESDSSEDET